MNLYKLTLQGKRAYEVELKEIHDPNDVNIKFNKREIERLIVARDFYRAKHEEFRKPKDVDIKPLPKDPGRKSY